MTKSYGNKITVWVSPPGSGEWSPKTIDIDAFTSSQLTVLRSGKTLFSGNLYHRIKDPKIEFTSGPHGCIARFLKRGK